MYLLPFSYLRVLCLHARRVVLAERRSCQRVNLSADIHSCRPIVLVCVSVSQFISLITLDMYIAHT